MPRSSAWCPNSMASSHWVEQLGEVDVTGVEPMTAVIPNTLRLRDDVVDADPRDRRRPARRRARQCAGGRTRLLRRAQGDRIMTRPRHATRRQGDPRRRGARRFHRARSGRGVQRRRRRGARAQRLHRHHPRPRARGGRRGRCRRARRASRSGTMARRADRDEGPVRHQTACRPPRRATSSKASSPNTKAPCRRTVGRGRGDAGQAQPRPVRHGFLERDELFRQCHFALAQGGQPMPR